MSDKFHCRHVADMFKVENSFKVDGTYIFNVCVLVGKKSATIKSLITFQLYRYNVDNCNLNVIHSSYSVKLFYHAEQKFLPKRPHRKVFYEKVLNFSL